MLKALVGVFRVCDVVYTVYIGASSQEIRGSRNATIFILSGRSYSAENLEVDVRKILGRKKKLEIKIHERVELY